MNIRFRPQPPSLERRAELVSALPKTGDLVRIIGDTDEYIVDSIGMKLVKLHNKDNPSLKKTAFRRDVIRIF